MSKELQAWLAVVAYLTVVYLLLLIMLRAI